MSTLTDALKGGGVAGVGLFAVLVILALVLSPALIALAWVFGVLSFEVTVVGLLVMIAYFSA